MATRLNKANLDWEIDRALSRVQAEPQPLLIVEARMNVGSELDFLQLRLNDGNRLLIPREQLTELSAATDEQVTDLTVTPSGRGVWWPRLDDGLFLDNLLNSEEPIAAISSLLPRLSTANLRSSTVRRQRDTSMNISELSSGIEAALEGWHQGDLAKSSMREFYGVGPKEVTDGAFSGLAC